MSSGAGGASARSSGFEGAGPQSEIGRRTPGVYVIGLTGGIASGKSTVSRMLSELGAVIIDADRIAHEVTAPGSPGLEMVRRAFGEDIVRSDGSLDRHRLGNLIFRDDALREKLNAIVHPLVMRRVEERLRELQDESAADGKTRIAVVDAPLLFEAGADALCDETWVVSLDRDSQAERLMKREGYTLDEAMSRINAQMPLDEKEKRATFIIDNHGSIEDTRLRVLELFEMAKKRSQSPPV